MRELKFRHWSEEAGMSKPFTFDDFDFIAGLPLHDEPSVIMQFTGLQDKNGVEIYEGDIVMEEAPYIDLRKPSPNPKVVGKEKRYWRVRYDTLNAAFVVTTGQRHSYLANKYYSVTVVGNIYENKRLLKETE